AMLATTKRAAIRIPLCEPCNKRWSQAATVIIGFVVALVLGFFAIRAADEPGILLGFMGLLIVGFFAMVFVFVRPRLLEVKKIDDREIFLGRYDRSAGEEVVRTLGGT